MHSFIGSELESYCAKYTKKTNSLLDQLEEETFKDIEDPQMISGHLSGNFLKLLCQMSPNCPNWGHFQMYPKS